MHLLYGSDGARFNLGRIPMGASDYGTSRYTDDEVASGTDYSMTSFSTSRDMQLLIPYVKAALAVNGSIRLWASPWTPPTWMKAGPFMDSHRLRRRQHDGQRPGPDGARAVLRQVRAGVRPAGDHDRDRGPPERAELQRELPVVHLVGGAVHEVRRPVPRPYPQDRGAQHEDHARHDVEQWRAPRIPRSSPA